MLNFYRLITDFTDLAIFLDKLGFYLFRSFSLWMTWTFPPV